MENEKIKEAEKVLSKYSVEQLKSKLEGDKLFGVSKIAAINLLNNKGIKVENPEEVKSTIKKNNMKKEENKIKNSTNKISIKNKIIEVMGSSHSIEHSASEIFDKLTNNGVKTTINSVRWYLTKLKKK